MALVPGLLRGALVSTLMLMSTTITAAQLPLGVDVASLGVNCTDTEIFNVYLRCIADKYIASDFLKDCQPQCQHLHDLWDCTSNVTSVKTACLHSVNRVIHHTPLAWKAIIVDVGAAAHCSFTFVNLIDICPDVPPLKRAVWSDWKAGECNDTCESGYATNTRSCVDVLSDPPNVTTGCVGLSTNATTCTSSPCDGASRADGHVAGMFVVMATIISQVFLSRG